MLRRSMICMLAAMAAAAPALAQDPVGTETVHFQKGATSTAIKGSITGYGSVNYMVGVKAGQTFTVNMKTSNASSYFNIFAPGAEEALFIGSTNGASYSGVIPSGGDYRVQVYMMRNAARRNESASYTLTIGAKG